MSYLKNKPKMAYSCDLSKMAIKDYQGLSWSNKDYQGLSRLSRAVTDYQILSRTVMGCHGLSWTVKDFHRLSYWLDFIYWLVTDGRTDRLTLVLVKYYHD